ncbi:peptidase M48 domain-containing protein [Ordospora colligata]|uniref:Peptidase M48 domain-containing protein n=1 Tax=Ordospora colligata OC4 TaxID=1354746 RepID=A0A0B2UKE7_9MICR|nr:peptidase M48 domain-containing protein [Ordospora colligata OC4]KHN69793.1 peptidase M48 domain-containing protein [Ordospora colligata OC4]TBU15596.1 peptidase M48 domain-containing protein [Ordospora colligata]TBU15663.1 peptidase M48 domain-containing protein [Ordospora colligata]TBU18714.1 peptidase M48 domain-containing protein [Ordospora colligata]
MKHFWKGSVYVFFALTYLALSLEALNIFSVQKDLDSGKTGLEGNLAANEMAKSDESYAPALRQTLSKRKIEIFVSLAVHTMHLLACIMFFATSARNKSLKLMDKLFGNIFKLGLVFLTFMLSMLMIDMIFDYTVAFLGKNPPFGTVLLICLCATVIVLPVFVFISTKLLRIFDITFIIACYLSYFALEILEVIFISDVNSAKMIKVAPEMFSESVQMVVSEQGLSESIYRERIAGNDVNAALIGIGSEERIEIYGSIQDIDKKELESIMMHEAGHSYYNSLAKKILVFFLLLITEMGILVFIFNKYTDKFVCENITKECSFVALACIYFVSVRPWIFILYNLTSQSTEISADILTKKYNYNDTLASVLYKISIQSFEFLAPSPMYNLLNSLHPSTLSRIEYLSN